MDVIVAYLDTMFSPYPTTPRLSEAKAELRAMMEDKYAELIASGHSENEAVGQVITEFGNLDELAPVLGITTDLGTGGHTGGAAPTGTTPSWSTTPDPTLGVPPVASPTPADPPVSLQEAQALAATLEATRWQMAVAVAGFVLSPVPLLLLVAASGGDESGADESGLVPILGVVALLVIVAACVLTLIHHDARLRPYERLKRGRFTPTAEVDAWASHLVSSHASEEQRALLVAIALWILSAVPTLVLSSVSDSDTSTLPVVGVSLTLVMVALGLLILLANGWAKTAAKQVTAEGRLAALKSLDTEGDPLTRAVAGAYWPVVVVIYLTWSFLGDAWDRSWIIWPIAGVLFGAVMAALSATRSLRTPQD